MTTPPQQQQQQQQTPASRRTLTVALLNYEAGGYRPDGSFDLGRLATAFDSLPQPPALFALNEAKNWHRDGQRVALTAADMLSDICASAYEVRLTRTNAAMLSALFYDPLRLSLQYWGDDTAWPDKQGLYRFALRGLGGTVNPVQVMVDHWAHYTRDGRYQRAQQLDHLGRSPYPSLLLGDLNGTASGLHLPQRDWTRVSYASASHRAVQDESGQWFDDTRALDHLIGRWQGDRRIGGVGMHAAAEVDVFRHGAGRAAFLPTVNDGVDAGGGQLVDWVLLNNAWLCGDGGVAPHSYRVHVPTSRPPSDHRLITVDVVVPELQQ